MRNLKISFITILIFSIFINTPSLADTIHLKSGMKIKGKIIERTDEFVRFGMEVGTEVIELTFFLDEIERIDTDTKIETKDTAILLSAAADSVLADISKLRQLDIKSKVNKEIVTKDQITAYVLKKLEENFLQDKITGEELMLKKLNLIPKDLKYKEFIIDLYTEQITGYYDAQEKKFFIVEGVPLMILTPVIAHELTHALQDQHFNLKTFTKPNLENSDLDLAEHAVIEGDATYVMLDFTTQSLGKRLFDIIDQINTQDLEKQIYTSSTQFDKFNNAPKFLQHIFIFSYTKGLEFVIYTVKNHGIEGLNRLYSDMPKSSEQILHPEKYFLIKDEPIEVGLEDFLDLLGKDWRQMNNDVMGEYSTYLLIKIFSDESKAKLASEGWGGDRIKVFQNQDNIGFIWKSVWDTEKDAQEFFQAYSSILDTRYKNAQFSASENIYEGKTEDGYVYVEIRGENVIVLEGFAEELIEELKNRI